MEREGTVIACCGLDCSKCEAYLATQADSDSQRAETARKWSELFHAQIEAAQINCDGCTSPGRKFFYCESACEIRKCCTSRGMDNCAGCSEYRCETLSQFVEQAPEAGEALERLR